LATASFALDTSGHVSILIFRAPVRLSVLHKVSVVFVVDVSPKVVQQCCHDRRSL
jgi:hypothetical protein